MSGVPRILVIDGYDTPGQDGLRAAGARQAGALYKSMLAEFLPEEQIDIAEISHAEPVSIDIDQYDGVCWTGSNLFFSKADAVVQRHIDLCQTLFERGTPQFGSCWAAQLAAVAAGGTVGVNPKGREFGLARKIYLTDAGRDHPMYKDKPPVFDGFTSHGDIITALPEGATLLASNSFSPVQALIVQHLKGEFWAVQYHPEYDTAEIGALSIARKTDLIKQGTFQDETDLMSYVKDMQTLDQDKTRSDIAWRLGVEDDLQDVRVKTLEVRNWLAHFFEI